MNNALTNEFKQQKTWLAVAVHGGGGCPFIFEIGGGCPFFFFIRLIQLKSFNKISDSHKIKGGGKEGLKKL